MWWVVVRGVPFGGRVVMAIAVRRITLKVIKVVVVVVVVVVVERMVVVAMIAERVVVVAMIAKRVVVVAVVAKRVVVVAVVAERVVVVAVIAERVAVVAVVVVKMTLCDFGNSSQEAVVVVATVFGIKILQFLHQFRVLKVRSKKLCVAVMLQWVG